MSRKMSPFARDILQGLKNAIAHARGEPTPGTRVHFVDIHNDPPPSSGNLPEQPDPPADGTNPPNPPNPPPVNRH